MLRRLIILLLIVGCEGILLEEDCAGVVGGTAVEDNCGVCGGGNENCITDIDGYWYKTVTIGTQLWMAENLRVTHYNNGDKITHIINDEDWGSYEEGQYGIYDNDSTNADIYGNLYNWSATANGTELGDLLEIPDYGGICPEDFHVPDHSDWDELLDFFGGWSGAGGILKECTVGSCPESEYWNSPNYGATNYSGFTALPAGRIFTVSNVFMLGNFTAFWSASFECSLYLAFNDSGAHFSCSLPMISTDGISVRCLAD